MAGLLDIDMNTPDGQGFNNALMQAAAMLLTPRHRGGGVGSAFAAFPQAIDRAKQNAMREQLLALQGRQVGLKTDKLGFDMEQAKAKQAEAMRNRENFARLVGTLPPEQRMIAEQLGPDYFKGMAPQPVKPTFQKWWENGRERSGFVAPGQAPQPVGDAAPQDMNKYLIQDENGNWVPNQAYIGAKQSVAKAGASNPTVYTGTMIPAEVGGQAGFVMPSKDGSVRLIPGIEPPGTAAKREAAATEATTARDFVNLIDMALEHPGRKTSTGLSGVLDPRNYLPGTDSRSYKAIHKQLEGKAFLNAYQSLKGGGPITDIEGRKSTEASIRLDTAQSDEEYEAALREARQLIAERYKKSTGKELPAQSGGKPKVPTISSDADYNALPSGAEFIAPDGSRRRKP